MQHQYIQCIHESWLIHWLIHGSTMTNHPGSWYWQFHKLHWQHHHRLIEWRQLLMQQRLEVHSCSSSVDWFRRQSTNDGLMSQMNQSTNQSGNQWIIHSKSSSKQIAPKGVSTSICAMRWENLFIWLTTTNISTKNERMNEHLQIQVFIQLTIDRSVPRSFEPVTAQIKSSIDAMAHEQFRWFLFHLIRNQCCLCQHQSDAFSDP